MLSGEAESIGIFDSFDRGLSSYASEERSVYIETKEQISDWVAPVEENYLSREREYLHAFQHGKTDIEFSPIVLAVDGYSRFVQILDNSLQEKISRLMKNGSHLGFSVIVTGSNNELTKGYDSLTAEIKQIRQAVVLMKKSEQTLFTLPYDRKETEIQPGYGYYVMNGKELKIQIPLCVTERKVLA